MGEHRFRTAVAHLALGIGAAGLLATGADHYYEYSVNGFSVIPTVGSMFLLNFISSTVVGIALLVPLRRLAGRFVAPLRTLLALAGIGIGGTSLIALWISETSGLFGFMDVGFRATIVVAIIAEATTVVALAAYLALAGIRLLRPGARLSY